MAWKPSVDPVEIQNFARTVALFLPEFEPTFPDWRALLSGPGGAELNFRGEQVAGNIRVTVSGMLPTEYTRRYHRSRNHSITVSLGRDPKQVAAAIQAKLLPDYLDDLAKATEKLVKDRADAAHADEVATELMRILGGHVGVSRSDYRRVYWYDTGKGSGGIEWSPGADTAKLELNSVPFAIVQKIVMLLVVE